MRLTLLAAAALCLAAPVAAQQPDPDSIGLRAMRQILANHADVEDYTLVLSHGAVRMPVYVHRQGELWKVSVPPDHPMGDLLAVAAQWPVMASEVLQDEGEVTELEGGARYVGTEEVGGRQAYVVWAGFDEPQEELPDTMRMYVDMETWQMLRLSMSARMGEEDQDESLPFGDKLRMTVDLSDYTAHDGLTLPMRMRLRMTAELNMTPQERKEAREQMALARAVLGAAEGDEGAQMRAMMDLFEGVLLRGEMDMAVQVEEVRVNSGPPAWLEDSEEP